MQTEEPSGIDNIDNIGCGGYDPHDNEILYIKNILPNWKSTIIDVAYTSSGDLQVKFIIAAQTREDVKLWTNQLQEKNKMTYSIKSTDPVKGKRVEFKQRLYCHHNTNSSKCYDPSKKKGRKNTNCPSKILIKIPIIKEHYKRNKEYDPEMPCEICYIVTHNHSLLSAEALRFRKVADEVKDKLLELFRNGHTPATALESIKMDISLLQDDVKILADRKYCPDYNYCYYIYQEFKKNHSSLHSITVDNEFLQKRRMDFKKSTGNDDSRRVLFQGSDYIICICPPLLRRVHERITAASEIVFIDSTGTVDRDGNRKFLMLTHSECGALPLCIFITSSDSEQILTLGFELLKSMVGSTIFGGNIDGPEVFMTADTASERAALANVFKKSKCLLCTHHILHSVWRWLTKSENEVPQSKQAILFQQFRDIIHARTVKDCHEKYREAKLEANDHPEYLKFMEEYWARKELWAWAFRSNISMHQNHTKAAARILKEKIFDKVKTLNATQMVDFLVTKFMLYYKHKLLDAAHNRSMRTIKSDINNPPPPGLRDRIQIITEDVVLVPSDTTGGSFHVVNKEAISCTCDSQEYICKHIEWAFLLVESDKYEVVIENHQIRENFYTIATGREPPQDWLKPLFGGVHEKTEISCNKEEQEIDTTSIVRSNKKRKWR